MIIEGSVRDYRTKTKGRKGFSPELLSSLVREILTVTSPVINTLETVDDQKDFISSLALSLTVSFLKSFFDEEDLITELGNIYLHAKSNLVEFKTRGTEQ